MLSAPLKMVEDQTYILYLEKCSDEYMIGTNVY